MAEAGQPGYSVLVLGGVGFIGRHLVALLVEEEAVSYVRVVDKTLPQMAWLSDAHLKVMEKVDFRHANLINKQAVEKAFSDREFDFVINCAAETKYGQAPEVYREGIVKLSVQCARESARRKVKRFIEVSTAQIYSTDRLPITEDCSPEPWTQQARHKVEVETELKQMSDLDFVIVRPSLVYGPGDIKGFTPRLVIGVVYKYLNEKMKMLWTKDLKINTVHVYDVARALWFLCTHGKSGDIYHLSDLTDTTQGIISELVSDIFDIRHGYHGTLVSNFARLNMDNAVQDINDKHLRPWSEACFVEDINNTPLTPYIDQELLLNRHLCVDGKRISRDLGFSYKYPILEKHLLVEILEDFCERKLFPKCS